MAALLWQFSYLQLLDALTTLAFLLVGVEEGNPVVRFALALAPNPFIALGAVKMAALGLGVFCAFRGKRTLLSRMNVMFALVVAWNLVALVVGILPH